MATSPQPETTQVLPAPDSHETSRDDWAGLTDPAERRRRQNRINQRAHRLRQRQRMRNNRDVHPKSVVSSSSSPSSSSTAIVPKESSTSPSASSQRDSRCLKPASARLLLTQFAESAFQSYMTGSPTSEHLLLLTKVNVFRAFGHNLKIMGWDPDNMDDDAISPFNIPTAAEASKAPDYSDMPLSLRPTKLQRTRPHHPWLDFFPLPKMRDNMIQAGDDWDDDALCHDIMGFWAHSSTAAPGLLVWGEPWDIRNWELTEAFLKKWQWIVRGCPEIMNSTNAWRARRGEKLIFRYI
ncbi:hypothetical protein PMG11_01193 [Penicillium brasilianum]|uniref:BZIP domain-containing protein n=1 Tax=Penicillium brasilianum TaxID=104259 RepID=A0A0F7THB8_PENBI|nr:hypothetical protein PMG11_01193 [Penicillium brasilianum]